MKSIDRQVENLVQCLEVESAHRLLTWGGGAADPVKLDQFRLSAGVRLFVNLKFTEAVEHLCHVETLDPRELLQLYPDLLPLGGLRYFQLSLLRRSRGPSMVDASGEKDEEEEEEEIRQCTFLPRHVTDMGVLIHHVLKQNELIGKADNRSSIEIDKESRVSLLKILEHRRALELGASGKRSPTLAKGDEEEIARAVDTAIFNLYASLPEENVQVELQHGSSYAEGGENVAKTKLEAFLETPNLLRLSDTTDMLQRQQQFHTLALLHAVKDRPREALEIWRRIGGGEYVDADGHSGVRETIAFLESHTVEEHIWTFSSWILRQDPVAATSVFTAGRRPPESELLQQRSLTTCKNFLLASRKLY